MCKRIRMRKCKHCGKRFEPDHRNVKRQKYCSEPDCQRVSKAASHRRWLNHPKNRDYFKGPENVQRVQQWRKANPGYSRRQGAKAPKALQDVLNGNTMQIQEYRSILIESPLQEVLSAKDEVLIGLIATLIDGALQDDIALAASKMKQLGRDILFPPNHFQGGVHVQEASISPKAGPPNFEAVQFRGPSPGS